MYRIAYIDESELDIRRFQRFARNHFEVVTFTPNREIEVTANEILESHVDALVADFDLKEQDESIHYSGTDLVSYILKERELFPVFFARVSPHRSRCNQPVFPFS